MPVPGVLGLLSLQPSGRPACVAWPGGGPGHPAPLAFPKLTEGLSFCGVASRRTKECPVSLSLAPCPQLPSDQKALPSLPSPSQSKEEVCDGQYILLPSEK